MRSATLPRGATEHAATALFTEGESTFRNAKLGTVSLVAYKAFADAAGKGSLFVITLVAARQLSAWAFGVFALGTTLGWLLAVVADFGVQMHLARAVAQAPDHAATLLRHWWRARAIATVASVAALTAVLLIWQADVAIALPLLAFAACYACTSLVEFLNYFYRGLSRSDIESTLTIAQRAATLLLAVAVLVWRPSVTLLALAMLIPAAIALLTSINIAFRLAAPHAPRLRPDGGTFARDVFPIGLGIVLSAIYFRIDVLLVEYWAGTEAVARYNAVFRVIDALRLFPAAVMAVVLPAFCTARTVKPLVRMAALVTAASIVAAVVLWTAGGRLVPFLFGQPFAAAVPAFQVLALAFPLLSLNLALTHQLVAWNRQREYAAVCAAALAVNLALNFWLIPGMSIDGAAWATVGTELCVTGGCVAALWMHS